MIIAANSVWLLNVVLASLGTLYKEKQTKLEVCLKDLLGSQITLFAFSGSKMSLLNTSTRSMVPLKTSGLPVVCRDGTEYRSSKVHGCAWEGPYRTDSGHIK